MYDPGELYYDPILSNFAVGWADQQLYADRLFPENPVNTQSARYRVFDRSDWMIWKSRREPGTVANEISGRKWSEDEFSTQEHSLQVPIYDEERQQLNSLGGFANPTFGGNLEINPEQDAVELAMRSIMLEREKAVADTIRDSSNYAGNHVVTLSGTAKWSDYTGSSVPVTNLKTAVQRVYLDTGKWVNRMIIPFDAVGIIENNPSVVARYQYTSVLDPNAWRLMLGLPAGVAEQIQVFVVDSKINTADNIDATESIASLWGQDVWLGYVDETAGDNVKTFGKTFAQTYPSGGTRPIDRWREENRKADLVRGSYKYDLKIVSPEAGYLIKNAVAAVT